jgi:DNA-binding transcriptional regulator YiaG
MHRRQATGARNRLDLNNRVQVRIIRKRLKVSDEQFANSVRTAGNSIAAITKEAGSRRRLTLPGV